MNLPVHTQPHQFACSSFEGGVGSIGIGPLDEHRLAHSLSGGLNSGGCFVPCAQAREVRIVRRRRTCCFRILEMDRIEPAVAGIVGIKCKGNEPIREATLGWEPAEQSRLAVTTVEIQICSELSGLFIQDIKRAVQVVHEDPVRRVSRGNCARFFPHEVDAGKEAHNLTFTVDFAGHRYGGEVSDFQRNLDGPATPVCMDV